MSPIRMVEEESNSGNFLLYFPGGRVAEWNGNIKGKWGMTEKEGGSWDINPVPITEENRIMIIDAFGLLSEESKFPLEILEKSSPKVLIEARRKLEKQRELRRVGVYRDGNTNWKELPAEKFG